MKPLQRFFITLWLALVLVLSVKAQGTWSAQNSGVTGELQSVYFTSANTGFAAGASGVIRTTTNGGTSWIGLTTGITGTLYWIQFVDGNTGYAAGATGTILKTTNGGSSWTPQNSGTTNTLYAIHFLDANTGWAVGNSGTIRVTTNGGTTWTAQTSGTTNQLRAVQFMDANTGYAVGASGTILKTINSGTTWATQTSGTTNTFLSVQFLDTTTGWAAGNAGTILKTVNGGSTWTAQTSGTTNFLCSIRFVDANTGWAVGNAGTILKTVNGGATWTTQTSGTTSELCGLQLLNANVGWAVGLAGTIVKYLVPGLSSLSYPNNPVSYAIGFAITPNIPSVLGNPAKYSVSPPLPAGLIMDTVTGIISGTPTTPAAAANYTITASNSQGSTTAVVNIATLTAPSGLSYSASSAQYVVETPITANTPTVTGTVTAYSVSPALPAGLTLNVVTGVISGTPTAASATANYIIKAFNGGVFTTATLSITVLATPSGLSYSSNPAVYIVGTSITVNLPNVSGSPTITYSVNPALPAGLILSTGTGAISGTPTTSSTLANYTITASNSVGSTMTLLAITVSLPLSISQKKNVRSIEIKTTGSSQLPFLQTGETDAGIKVSDMLGRQRFIDFAH